MSVVDVTLTPSPGHCPATTTLGVGVELSRTKSLVMGQWRCPGEGMEVSVVDFTSTPSLGYFHATIILGVGAELTRKESLVLGQGR